MGAIPIARSNKNYIMSEIFNIFPTTIMKFNRPVSPSELREAGFEKIFKNKNNNISENRNILEKDSYSFIKQFILDSLETYNKTIFKPKNSINHIITESWLNYINPGQSHHAHKHPNSITSGVYYFECLDKDFIRFDREKHHYIEIEPSEYDLYNSDIWDFPVFTGDLLLFPSDLAHSVVENNTNKTRISLSFNTFLEGDISLVRSRELKLCTN